MKIGYVALVLVGCATEKFKAGDSMLPSIGLGATISVERRAPARGDVVVFRAPERPSARYVKRVVGLAGDTIAMNGDTLVVNGKPMARCDVGAWAYDDAPGVAHRGELWLEALDSTPFLVFHESGKTSSAAGPWTVASGEVFVVGDNRDNSHDSRVWFDGRGGGLPVDLIVGVTPRDTLRLPDDARPLASELARCRAQLTK
jgi:signal peptidase I